MKYPELFIPPEFFTGDKYEKKQFLQDYYVVNSNPSAGTKK